MKRVFTVKYLTTLTVTWIHILRTIPTFAFLSNENFEQYNKEFLQYTFQSLLETYGKFFDRSFLKTNLLWFIVVMSSTEKKILKRNVEASEP
jgi:hypothetical protein